jgi:hypothetical protein
MKTCPHQKTDNKDILNCTKNDSTIGYCKTPCPHMKQPHMKQPHMKQPHPQLAKYSYIRDGGETEPLLLEEPRIKLRIRIFECSYILIEADEGE